MRIDVRIVVLLLVIPPRSARLCLRLNILMQALRGPVVQFRLFVPMLLRYARQMRVTVSLA